MLTVDVSVRHAYVGRRMNLLLLLSALLSALTGVGGSVRSPDVAQAVAGSVRAVDAVAVRQRVATSRPAQALPVLTIAAAMPLSIELPLAVREPLWTGRRRE
jgi:hypothetical protein